MNREDGQQGAGRDHIRMHMKNIPFYVLLQKKTESEKIEDVSCVVCNGVPSATQVSGLAC